MHRSTLLLADFVMINDVDCNLVGLDFADKPVGLNEFTWLYDCRGLPTISEMAARDLIKDSRSRTVGISEALADSNSFRVDTKCFQVR